MIEPVKKSIVVGCNPDAAFRIFTDEIAAWWPLGKNSVSAMEDNVARSLVLESREGGLVYEIKADGSRADWAIVKVFEPGKRLRLAWHVMSPQSEATDVDIVFTPNDAGAGTRVELTHSGWEILGEAGQGRRDGYASGWVSVFETAFAQACAVAA
ncbi:MAG: SRPBCC domain-containing protein [Pseudomonadota bacterium]